MIVVPEARSILRTANDVAMPYAELKRYFMDRNFDFSRLDELGGMWQIETMVKEDVRKVSDEMLMSVLESVDLNSRASKVNAVS